MPYKNALWPSLILGLAMVVYAAPLPGQSVLGDVQTGQVGVSGQAGISGEAKVSEETVREVQQALKDKGLYTGQVDGKWGTKTKAALKAFQESNGLAATGQLDAETKAKLDM